MKHINNDTKRKINKETVYKIVTIAVAIIVPFLCALYAYKLSDSSAQETIVEELSTYFDFVDDNMSYKQALQAVYEESQQKDEIIRDLNQQIATIEADSKNEINKLNNQMEDLELQISNTPNFEFKNPSLIFDGLKIQNKINKSILVLNNSIYYSENILNLMLQNEPVYDSSQNTLYYNKSGEQTNFETKINLLDTTVLYDGTYYDICLPSNEKTISMGNNTFNKGFVISSNHASITGKGDGYVLLDLQGKYSKITFEAGRVNGYEKQNAVLKVYIDNEYVEEFELNADIPSTLLDINLNYANSLKLEVVGDTGIMYGFVNAVLHY